MHGRPSGDSVAGDDRSGEKGLPMKILGFAIDSGPLLTMLAVLAIALGLGWTFLAGAQGAAGSTGITTLDHTKHRGVVVEGKAYEHFKGE